MKPTSLALAACALLAGCASNAPDRPAPPSAPAAPAPASASAAAPSAPSGEAPFDARFIDAMIPHHEGAVSMAREALTKAEHAELKDLAPKIIAEQEAEIARMRAWRQAWHPALPPTGGLPMPDDHGAAGGEHGAGEAHGAGDAHGASFDVGFIDRMIPHHEGAIVMAERALLEAEHDELKQLAASIIDSQRREIAQMRAWREAWTKP